MKGANIELFFKKIQTASKNIFAKEEALFYLNSYLCRMMQK
jgi:hypothetical protein